MRLLPLQGIERDIAQRAVQKVDAVLIKLLPLDASVTNYLLYVKAVIFAEMVVMNKAISSNNKETWWKGQLDKQLRELNIDLGRLNALIENGKIKRKHKDDLKMRCKIKKRSKQRELKTILEEIKPCT